MSDVNKLSYYFGYESINSDTVQLYLNQVKALMEAVDKRLLYERDNYIKENALKRTGEWRDDILLKGKKNIFAAGAIVTAPSYFADQHPSVVKSLISIINPSVILIIDHDGLKSALKDIPNCHVIKLPKSGGVIHLAEAPKRKQREIKFENFFFDERAICTRDQIPLTELTIYRLSKTTVGMGLSHSKQELQLIKIDPLITELNKYVIGVTTLPMKLFNNLPEHARIEALVHSPIMTLAFVFEVKDIQQKSSSSEGAQKEACIIRPSYIPTSYSDQVWIVGDTRNFHN